MDVAITATIVMVVALVIILLMGAPIAVAIGMSSAMAMVVILPTNVALVTCAQKMFTGLNSFPLLAIPFFVLAGNLMNNGGIAIRIIRLAEALCGRLPGALAESNVLANMFFGAISGSGNAAAAEYTGVKVNKVLIQTYILSGILSATAGLLYCGRTKAAKYTYGEGVEMDVIAAVVLGGTAMSGGTGNILGSIVGALLMGMINNGLIMGGLSVSQQKIVRGIIIIIAVAIGNLQSRKKKV